MNIRQLLTALSALLILAAAGLWGVVGLVSRDDLSAAQIGVATEAAKSLMHLVVVIVIGGTVAALFKALDASKRARASEADKRREEAQLRSAVRVDYLSRVGKSYRLAKGTRRALRAAGMTTKFGDPPAQLSDEQVGHYRAQMKILDEAQSELEALKIEAASLPALLELNELPNLLGAMEKYLRKVVREYERESARLANGGDVDFGTLNRLREFSGASDSGGDEGFEVCLATPHDKVIQLVATSTSHGAPDQHADASRRPRSGRGGSAAVRHKAYLPKSSRSAS